MGHTLEACNAGGWKARFDNWDDVASTIRQQEALDVDTDHMLLWHRDDVKCSFVKSSGVLMLRTEDREQAEKLLQHALGEER